LLQETSPTFSAYWNLGTELRIRGQVLAFHVSTRFLVIPGSKETSDNLWVGRGFCLSPEEAGVHRGYLGP
jgi:hypothetical protein